MKHLKYALNVVAFILFSLTLFAVFFVIAQGLSLYDSLLLIFGLNIILIPTALCLFVFILLLDKVTDLPDEGGNK